MNTLELINATRDAATKVEKLHSLVPTMEILTISSNYGGPVEVNLYCDTLDEFVPHVTDAYQEEVSNKHFYHKYYHCAMYDGVKILCWSNTKSDLYPLHERESTNENDSE